MNTIPGWKLVPCEPTGTMLLAGTEGDLMQLEEHARFVYGAMINAAPVPPEPSMVGELPAGEMPELPPVKRGFYGASYDEEDMHHYASTAIAADRARRVGDDEPAAYMEVDGEDVFFHLGHPPDNEYSHLLTPLFLHPSTAKPDAEMVPVADYHRAIEVMCNAQKAFDKALGLPDDDDEAGPDRTLEAIEALQSQLRAALASPTTDAASLVEAARDMRESMFTHDGIAAMKKFDAAIAAHDQQTGGAS